MVKCRKRLQRIARTGELLRAAVPQLERGIGRNDVAQRHRLSLGWQRRGRKLHNCRHQLLVDGIHLVDVDVADFLVLLQIEARVETFVTRLRNHIAAAQYAVGQEDVDVALDVQRHLRACVSRINGDHQACLDVFGLQYPGERQGTKSAHRMTDQDDRSGIVTVIADSLIRDQPANGEFVDVSPDAGFFEALGQAVHPARKDRPECAAEQVDARLRLDHGWRCDGGGRRGSSGGACDRSGERQIATGREDAGGKSHPDHHGRNLRRTAHAVPSAILGVHAHPNATQRLCG